ncbi:unnamed protein product, partial [Mesorhabditis belari]|uniref:Uncharacterized protein n=1 Tax=Mesorhabditis belari TaxID=2138241 RepID=A0AAF3FHK6_9BILA
MPKNAGLKDAGSFKKIDLDQLKWEEQSDCRLILSIVRRSVIHRFLGSFWNQTRDFIRLALKTEFFNKS